MLIRKETKTRTLEDITYHCKCDICGKEFQTRWGASSCCSNGCYKVLSEQYRKAAIKRSTQTRKERRDAAKAQLPDSICVHCQKSFRPLRKDAQFCSDACRQAGYRERKSELKESKPFLLECFRLPENERKESPFEYFSSTYYTNGIGFDKLIEKLEGIPKIKDNVKVVELTKDERLDRQKLHLDKYQASQMDYMPEYPFFVLSKGEMYTSFPVFPGEDYLENLLQQLIIEKIDRYAEEKNAYPKTKVVHCMKEPYDIYIGRANPRKSLKASKWKNPFTIGKDGAREEVIEKYKEYFFSHPELVGSVGELKGKVLGCWCKPDACHGDFLAEMADKAL